MLEPIEYDFHASGSVPSFGGQGVDFDGCTAPVGQHLNELSTADVSFRLERQHADRPKSGATCLYISIEVVKPDARMRIDLSEYVVLGKRPRVTAR